MLALPVVSNEGLQGELELLLADLTLVLLLLLLVLLQSLMVVALLHFWRCIGI